MAWQAVLKTLWSKYGQRAVVGLLKMVTPDVVLRFLEAQLGKIGARSKAIKKARQVRDGRWGPILVEDKARWVVYSGESAVEIFPTPRGELAELTATYNTDLLRSPDDVTSAEFKRWVESRWRRLRKDVEDGTETPVAPESEVVRDAVSRAGEGDNRALLHAMFDECPRLLDQLTSAPGKTVADHNGIPEAPGVYLFGEGVSPLYVGRTRKLRTRLRQHTSLSSRENQAALAWQIALKDATAGGHALAGTRKELEADPVIAECFSRAKERVAAMEVRFIEIDDPVTSTVFEVYAARALGTDEFNSWETH